MDAKAADVAAIEKSWSTDRFRGVTRPYPAADVHRLRGSIVVEHTLARLGAERLWQLLGSEDYVAVLGAGYRAVKHQKFVGAGYFDEIAQVLSQGHASTAALAGSTEEEQFAVAREGAA